MFIISIYLTEHFTPIEIKPDEQETTNSYADVEGSLIDTNGKGLISFICKNTDGSNSIDWQVLASNDNSVFTVVQVGASLAAAAVGVFSSIAYYRYYKVQVKATTPDSQGDATVKGISKP